MATAYPTALDTSTQQPSPSASTEMDDAGFLHDEVHTNASGALIALETKLGIGSTTAAGASTNHVLVKQGDGDTEWAAVPAAVPTTITVADTTDTTCSVALFESATGDLAPKSDAGATYNAATGVLTATGFAGPLTGNVTGDASGSSGSTTGNAATATNSTTVTVADTTDTTCSVALFEDATGSLGAKTDAGATYNAGTGTLTATAFAGPLTGNVTGNASGTALTVTQADQAAITSVGSLTGLTVSGNLTVTGTTTNQLNVVTAAGAIAPAVGDENKYVRTTGTAVVTLPQNTAQAFAVGATIYYERYGSGTLTFVAGTGVTELSSKDGTLTCGDRYTTVAAVKTGTNTWALIGNIG
jgi:hypothetical protein